MIGQIALVSPFEVKKHLCYDLPYVIIDARPHSHYLSGHSPGAIWMNWEAWCEEAPIQAGRTLAQAGYWGVLKEITTAFPKEHLEQLGLSNECPVLVYADGPSSKGREGRIAWMLLYWGVSRLFLLNGGWSAWLKSGGGSDVATPTPKRGEFQVCIQKHRRISLRQLKQDYERNTLPTLVDVRSLPEFEGRRHAYQPRLRRLSGALHLPFTELFDNAGNYIRKREYLQRLPPKILSTDQLITYCEVGVRSCLLGSALRKEARSRKGDKCGTVCFQYASDVPIIRARSSAETRV